jgi:biopolymer transport protein ExbD
VAADGRYAVYRKLVDGRNTELLAAALLEAAGGSPDSMVIVSADAAATHQMVVAVLDAARRAGLVRLTFATQGHEASGR